MSLLSNSGIRQHPIQQLEGHSWGGCTKLSVFIEKKGEARKQLAKKKKKKGERGFFLFQGVLFWGGRKWQGLLSCRLTPLSVGVGVWRGPCDRLSHWY